MTASSDRPSVTIVVATHKRPLFLPDCAASIAAAMGEEDELLVIESGGNKGASALSAISAPVTYVTSLYQGKSAKLNAGIRAARNEVILITDDDCRVLTEWVEAMARPFTNPAVGVAFGPVVGLTSVRRDAGLPAIAAGPAPPELWNYAHGASMAVRKSAAIDAGGFDERLGPGSRVHGEEADLVLRLASRGWTCEIADAPTVRNLDWRSEAESMQNRLTYQRGSGAYLGAGLRREPRRIAKPLALRLRHEARLWRDRRTQGWWFGPRMTISFALGLLDGVLLPARRFLDTPAVTPFPETRRRVLWVTDEPPDRNQGGGNIRQAMLLDILSDRFDVTLLLVGHLDDEVTRRRLVASLELPRPRLRTPRHRTARRIRDLWQAIARRSPSEVVRAARVRRVLRPTLERIADGFDAVVVHHLFLAPLLPTRHREPWLLHLFDVSSERVRQELANEPGRRQRWLLSREIAKAAHYERRVAAAYDGVVVVSERDAATVGNHPERPRACFTVVPNGIDASALTPTPLPAEHNILLPATLNYRPNVLGAIWFCDEVLPLVQSKVPDVRFDLVGRHPVSEVSELGQRSGVHVHANVASMTPWLARARVVIVPLRIGTGTRLKALEAMAAGRPVVGTSIGLADLGVVDGEQVRVADDPGAMADALVELLTFDWLAESLVRAGRRFVAERFEWTTLADRFADALELTVSRRDLAY